MIGETLAHYEILDKLGQGGMGEVYRARDTKLGREVALKLLPDEVSADPERIARFRREAKLLASLNHPNIAALYDLEETDGRVFLTMEIAEGENLDERLKRGAIPVDEALDQALQITEGLEEAHAKGIVHRDLKPANIMLLPSGRIKLLDFGLARAYLGDDDEGDPKLSPTITAAMTQAGTILGTAAYMSPEQARGKSVNKQSDIWAFGAVLYEMLTGHRLFDGETISDSIGAILHKEADWNQLPANTPPQIHQLLHRCLERDQDQRLRDIGDARVALGEARRDPTGSTLGLSAASVAPSGAKGSRAWILALVLAFVGTALGTFIGSQLLVRDDAPPYRKLDLGMEIVPGPAQSDGSQVAINRDGTAVTFAHDDQIWVQYFDELEARPLEDSEEAFSPFWSPDGEFVGWFQQNKLWKAPARGGRAIAICELEGRLAGGLGAHWEERGEIVFAKGSAGIYSVSARGGTPEEIIPVEEGIGDLHEPYMLPEDQGILLVVHPAERSPGVLALRRGDETTILFETAAEGRIFAPFYDGMGRVLFRQTRGDATEGLWAMDFDPASGNALSEPYLVEPDASAGNVSKDGTLVFVSNPRRESDMIVVRVDRNGNQRETVVPTQPGLEDFAISPDGSKICFNAESSDGSAPELYVRDLVRGTEMTLTNSGVPLFFPRWSADGREIFYSLVDFETASVRVWKVPADGSRPATMVTGGAGAIPVDGGILVSRTFDSDSFEWARADSQECWFVPLEDTGEERKLLGGGSRSFSLGISRDGDYLLYGSDSGGTFTVYLTRYPSIRGRWQVSGEGEVNSGQFGPDDSSIYYTSGERLFEVAFQGGPEPRLGTPQELFELPPGTQDAFEVDAGGESFLIARTDEAGPDEDSAPRRRGIKIVQNWTQGLGPQ